MHTLEGTQRFSALFPQVPRRQFLGEHSSSKPHVEYTACKRHRHPTVHPAIHPSHAAQHLPDRTASIQKTRSPPPVHTKLSNMLTLTNAALCCVDR